MNKLKIGLLLDDIHLSDINSDLVHWILQNEKIKIDLLIINNLKRKKLSYIKFILKKYSIKRILEKIFFKIIFQFEKFIYNIFFNKYFFNKCNLDKKNINKLLVRPNLSKNGFFYTYDKGDIENIKNYNLDIIIRMGSGILKGEILESSKYGVLSFHHADNNINRGGPAGFWEVYYRQPSSGFIIQQLNEILDGGNVLYKGYFPTKVFFYLNQVFLYKKSNYYFKKLLSEIIKNNSLPKNIPTRPHLGKIYKDPNFSEIIKYLFKTYSKIFVHLIQKIFFKKETWYVAYKKSNFKNSKLLDFNFIENKPNSFNADPFLYKHNNKNYLFVENYNFKVKKGIISVYVLNEDKNNFVGDALIEDFHLSFPYIFSYQEKIYMCPETSHINEIRIYESEEFPLKWKYKKTLIKNISAADTIIFEHNNIWWLLTNIDYSKINDHNSELSIFYSTESPITSNWKEHKKNPLIVNSDVARNGGIIFDNGIIYRVSQRNDFNIYGKEFDVNKITELNSNNYKENKIINVKPNFFKNIFATHHFGSNNDYTVIDCCKNNYCNIDIGLKKQK